MYTPLTFLYDDGEPVAMRCTACGEVAQFDETLPYVNQTSAFITGHECVLVPPEDPQ